MKLAILLVHLPLKLRARLLTFAYRRLYRMHPTARVVGYGTILSPRSNPDLFMIGRHTVLSGELFVLRQGGRIRVGDWCFIGQNSRIWSACDIVIGDRVLISHDVNIHDTDSHPLDPIERHAQVAAILTTGHPAMANLKSAPISIGDDAWVGFGATILKGVTVGAGAIIAARSVVTHDVPPGATVAGNPARIIRRPSNDGELQQLELSRPRLA